jgi:hypothetical protein
MTENTNPQDSNAPQDLPETNLGPGGTINIGEEFGTARRALPPVLTVVMAIAAVVIAGFLFAYLQQAKPRATGSIQSVSTAQALPDQLTLAAVTVQLHNGSGKRLWIKSVRGELQTAAGEQSADAIAAGDFQRFFTAFPALKTNAQPALAPEDVLQPGESATRTLLFGFHTTAEEFAQRKLLSVVILPYDEHVEIVLK